MIAYAMARLRFPGRGLLVTLIISLMIIPIESVVIPMLLMVNSFGLLDTYTVQILPFIADAFSIFLFYQFFSEHPQGSRRGGNYRRCRFLSYLPSPNPASG